MIPGKHDIYYRQLLPFDIQKILSGLNQVDQRTVSIRLRKLPEDSFLLKKLCLEYIENQKIQVQANLILLDNSGENQQEGISFETIKFGKIYADEPNPVALRAWEYGTYVYGITKNGATYVLDKMEDIASIKAGMQLSVSSGDFEAKVRILHEENQEGEFLSFGSFRIRLKNDPGFNYTPQGIFENRLRDARLMHEIMITRTLDIEGITLCRDINMLELTIEDIEEQIAGLEKYVRLFEELKLKVKWDPDNLSDYEFYQIEKLGSSLIDGKSVPLNGISDKAVNLNIDIQNARIKALATMKDDGLYALANPMSKDMLYAIGEEGKEDLCHPVPAFFILNQEDFRLAANIDKEVFEESLRWLPIGDTTAEYGCNKLLQMLKAYNEGAVCGAELLECSEILANHLLTLDPSSEAYIINKAQVTKHKGQLTAEGQKQLRDIALSSDNDSAKACAYLLLDQQEFAERILSKMSAEKKAEFLSWPITAFMK